MDSAKAVAIIKQIGIGDLGYFDGCLCCHFQLQSFSVDVSCHKSSSAKPEYFWGIMVRVHSGYLGCSPQDLKPIADEVVRQLRQWAEETPIMIRYCDYDYDSKLKCCYCGEKRSSYEAYLCDNCLAGKDAFGQNIAETRDYSKLPTIG